MKADKIFKNAKIFTSDSKNPMAAALAVKDGKFVYVGDEAGLSAYEGEVTDRGGKLIMPGLNESHLQVNWRIRSAVRPSAHNGSVRARGPACLP